MLTRRQAITSRLLLAPALTLSLVLAGCGASSFATTFRVVIAAGAPILDVLERQGKISHSLRIGLIADLTSEAGDVSTMASCFDTIPQGDAQSKVKHLQCIQTLEQSADTKKLLSDFGSNSAVSQIAADFDSVLQAAIIFYGGGPKSPSLAGGQAQTVTESEIKARVDRLKKDLGQ